MNKGDSVKVLNHGFLRLIDYMGNDLSIVRNARQSYDAQWRAGEDNGSDERLIRYLMKNGHNTPFESVEVQFEVHCPIFVARQWFRHRTQSFSEVSARYTKLPREYYVPYLSVITKQSADNKQMRTDEPLENAKAIQEVMDEAMFKAFAYYDMLIEMGCPRELARTVLPLGTYTNFFAKANLHNWFRFLHERLHKHAQYEIRRYAQEILAALGGIAPVAVESFVSTLTGDHIIYEEETPDD